MTLSNHQKIINLKKAIELLFRQNNNLAIKNLELKRQQEAMLNDIDKISTALNSRSTPYDFQTRPSHIIPTPNYCRSLDGNTPFRKLSNEVAESIQASKHE